MPGVDRTVAPWSYEGPARELVLRLKLRGRRDAAASLADGMARAARRAGLGGAALAWVPGRPRVSRRRGFDHAELLARELATRLGIPARPLLVRLSDPADQTLLTAAERRANLEGVFAARPSPSRVVIIDDLVTTGATLTACARALRTSGAGSIEALVACRA